MITVLFICIGIAMFYFGQNSIALIVLVGIIGKYMAPFILTLLALPGRMVAFPDNYKSPNKSRIIVGSILMMILQLAACLVYAGTVAHWTRLAVLAKGANLMIWIFAFLAVTLPVLFAFKVFREQSVDMQKVSNEVSEGSFAKKMGVFTIKMRKMIEYVTLVSVIGTIIGFILFTMFRV